VYHWQGPKSCHVLAWAGQHQRPALCVPVNHTTTLFGLRLLVAATLARGGWLDPLRAHKDLHLARSTKLAWRTSGKRINCEAQRSASARVYLSSSESAGCAYSAARHLGG
jgi:hypothetical protein